jgi:hypothetical protein
MTDVPSDPDSAELARLNREVEVLTARAERARLAGTEADAILYATRRQRDLLADRLHVAAAGTATATFGAADTAPAGILASAVAGPPAGPPPLETAGESSTRAFQTVLFVLSGLLLGTAAVVFTAVAWATYGVTGRALILAVVTVLALAAPLVALRRRLTATAETFAGVGLLLVALDGYAVWYVNLFDVATIGGSAYAAAVCTVTAAVAAGYRAATGLAGPAFAAMLAAQPILPLFAAQYEPALWGWAVVAAGVAALNLLILAAGRGGTGGVGTGIRVAGWVFFGSALMVSTGLALAAEVIAADGPGAARAGAATVLVALVLVGAAVLSGSGAFHALSGCVAVLAVGAATARYAALAWPDRTLLAVAGSVATIAVLGTAFGRLVPATARPGIRAGILVAAGALAVPLAGMVAVAAEESLATPMWTADLFVEPRFTWQLLAALGLASLALATAVPRRAWVGMFVVTGALAVLALPGSVILPWWAPPILDTVAATIAGSTVVAGLASARTRALPGWAAAAGPISAAVLAGHAVLASLARPELTAGVLGGLAVAGVAIAVAAGRETGGPLRAVAGSALAAGLAVLPAAVGSWLVAIEVETEWAIRGTTASVAVVLGALAAVHRLRAALVWYAFTAGLISAAVWPVVGALSGIEPMGVYAALGLVAAALCLLAAGRTGFQIAAPVAATAVAPAALLLVSDLLAPVAAVVLLPLAWVDAIWSGVPSGVGLAPPGVLDQVGGEVTGQDAIALVLLASAAAIAAYARTGRLRSAIGGLGVGGPTAILVGLTAAEAPWPAVPAVTLVLGLGLVVIAAAAPIGRARAAIAATQGLWYAGAGLAGALTVEWSTLATLGTTVVAAAVVGSAGRTPAWRISGAAVAVAAALATAAAAGFAAELAARSVAFCVLAAAGLALAGGTALSQRRSVAAAAERAGIGRPAIAAQTAAHAGAVVALALTTGHPRHAAAVCAFWGVAVGVRALRPGAATAERRAHAAAAAASELFGWWLLLAGGEVALVEAYTLPAALVALIAGWAARSARPNLRSWIAYGPALCAAFLPTLATILAGPGEPWRRLLLFVGSIAVIVAGSMRRLQAPVVVGGGVVALVALHELALYWDLIPRWIPLAIGGLVLLSLAITYERRLRNLVRIRGAVARMR